MDLGFIVTLRKADGTTLKTYGVWGTKESADREPAFPSAAYGEDKPLYVPGTLKRAPEPGDTIAVGATTWSVSTVEEYKPATVALAYKVGVTG